MSREESASDELRGLDPALPRVESSFHSNLADTHGASCDPTVEIGTAGGSSPAGRRLERLARWSGAGRYLFRGEVGRGGMGAILEAFDTDLRRSLAMKVMLKGRSDGPSGAPRVDPEQLARFLEEAQVTGQLDHPGVVPVHELGVDAAGRV